MAETAESPAAEYGAEEGEPTQDEILESIQMIYDAFLKLDEDPNDEALREWCMNVCDPETDYVDGFVANFIAYVEDKEFSKKILKLLKKMNEHFSKVVLQQLVANMHFPGALVKYLEETELKDLSGDALILLVNVFDDRVVSAVSDAFTQKLVDSLQHIVDESVLDALVSVLAVLYPYYEKKDPCNNLVHTAFLQRETFFKEKLIHIGNRASQFRLDKILQTLGQLMTKEETKDTFFTVNDFDVIIDVCLRELEKDHPSRDRIHIFKVLYIILCTDKYILEPAYSHRIDQYKKVIESVVVNEDDAAGYVTKERINIIKINQKLLRLSQK